MREELECGDIKCAWNLFAESEIALNFNFSLTCTCEFDMIDVCDILAAIYACARLWCPYESHGYVYKVLAFVILSRR